MIIHNPILTGSFTVNGTDVASITSSAASITAINAYTASQNILNGTYTLTSSFAAQTASFTAFTSSVNSFTASQLVLNGTYATTSSNTFAGIQTVNSNLVVTGSITAQTLIVSTINATQSYSSGSNIFGNALNNTQTFTGSLLVTGSSTFSGALTAGATTLNGNLQFASGYFINMPWESDTRTVWERYTNATYFQRISSNGTARQLRLESNGAYGNASIVLDGQGNTTTSTIITSDNSIFTGTVSLNTGNNIRLYRPDSSFPSTSWYWNINMTSGNLLSFAINSGTAKMVIDASGNVGIGTTSPTYKLQVSGSNYGVIRGDSLSNPTFDLWQTGLENAAARNWRIVTNYEAWGSYDFQVSTNNATAPSVTRISVASSGVITFNAYGSGTLTSSASGVISASDGRYKTKTRSISNALNAIMQLNPTYYRWNEDSEFHTEYEELGFIAQEVASIIPAASPEPEQEGKYKNYSDRAIIAMLTKAIQELKSQNDDLQAQITELKNK